MSLIVYFKKELNIMHGDRCFGHLPVVGCVPDEDACQFLIQGIIVCFPRFTKHTPTAKCNFVAG